MSDHALIQAYDRLLHQLLPADVVSVELGMILEQLEKEKAMQQHHRFILDEGQNNSEGEQ